MSRPIDTLEKINKIKRRKKTEAYAIFLEKKASVSAVPYVTSNKIFGQIECLKQSFKSIFKNRTQLP